MGSSVEQSGGICCFNAVEINIMLILQRQLVNMGKAEFALTANSFSSTLKQEQIRIKAGSNVGK